MLQDQGATAFTKYHAPVPVEPPIRGMGGAEPSKSRLNSACHSISNRDSRASVCPSCRWAQWSHYPWLVAEFCQARLFETYLGIQPALNKCCGCLGPQGRNYQRVKAFSEFPVQPDFYSKGKQTVPARLCLRKGLQKRASA